MIESPRGRPVEMESVSCPSKGGSGSSALIPKAKHSNEKARFRPPPLKGMSGSPDESPVISNWPRSRSIENARERDEDSLIVTLRLSKLSIIVGSNLSSTAAAGRGQGTVEYSTSLWVAFEPCTGIVGD